MAMGRRPMAMVFIALCESFRGTFYARRPKIASNGSRPLRPIMPVKHVVVDLYPPLKDQQVHGWPFRGEVAQVGAPRAYTSIYEHIRVDGPTGLVCVGTDKVGPYKRWTFRLSTYGDDAADPVFSPRSPTGEHLSVLPRLVR